MHHWAITNDPTKCPVQALGRRVIHIRMHSTSTSGNELLCKCCKPTRADYSATTGSQTAGHNATHVVITKRPKSVVHCPKISMAFQSRSGIQTHGIQNYRDHSQLIALTMRRDETKSERKSRRNFIGNDFGVLCPAVSDHVVTLKSGPEGSHPKHHS